MLSAVQGEVNLFKNTPASAGSIPANRLVAVKGGTSRFESGHSAH